MGKNIALFIDGTWNEPGGGHPKPTNVCKLHERAEAREGSGQVSHYLQGVGTDRWLQDAKPWRGPGRHLQRLIAAVPRPVRNTSGGIWGWGTANRIREAYLFLALNFDHRAGDHVFLFGFSRGAFAARSLAGFVDRVGLLLKPTPEGVEKAYELYEHPDEEKRALLGPYLKMKTGSEEPSEEGRTTLPVYFIGVWDTVAALGARHLAPTITANLLRHHDVQLPANITHARHALALHELRRDFAPLLWNGTNPKARHQSLAQVWFPGAHADVGGGYLPREAGPSDGVLSWMATEAGSLGLDLDPAAPAAQPDLRLHHEIRKWFLFCRPTLRPQLDHPRVEALPTSTMSVHPSATRRLLAASERTYRAWRPLIAERLRQVDEATLRLHLELSFHPQPVPQPWRDAGIDAASGARDSVSAFLEGSAGASAEHDAAFIRALGLQILCDGHLAARTFRDQVMRVIPHDLRDADRLPTRLEELRILVELIKRTAALLPPNQHSRVLDCASSIEASLEPLQTRVQQDVVAKKMKILGESAKQHPYRLLPPKPPHPDPPS